MTWYDEFTTRFAVVAAVAAFAAPLAAGCSDGVSSTNGSSGTSSGMGGAGGMGGGSACGTNQVLCGDTCTDTQVDAAHCGSCTTTCAAGEVCSLGKCSLSCGGGTTQCGTSCIDVSNDPANCGMCGTVCAAEEVCSAGKCGLLCTGSTTKCGALCVDVANDPANCGACATTCGFGQVCSAGKCAISCGGGTTKCGNVCVTVANDPANCGNCGTACASGEICSAGKCSTTCGGGSTKCGTACVNTANDPANCGACGTVCGPYPAGTGVCVAGACAAICTAGSANCNGNLMDGCESTQSTDAQNCGFCGNVCPAIANATASCMANACGFACNMGFGDCNNSPSDGCETDTQSSVANCGACGNACPVPANATAMCTLGACGFTCNTNFHDCNNMPADGCESNQLTDSQNCGTCGTVCMNGQICLNGTCGASSIPQLSGTQTTDIVRGSTHNSFFADPVTGKVYWHAGYTGSTIMEYTSLANFVSNTGTTITLASPLEGTYHAALNGFLYYNTANTSTIVKVNAANGAVVNSATLPNAGHTNTAHFNWGGYSDIDFYTDTGNLLYVIYAASTGANMQISKLDPNSLVVLQTWTIPRVKTNTGFAFLVNGVVYVGFTFNLPAINAKFTLATGVYDTAYTNSFTPVVNDYITDAYWDPTSKRLFEVSNTHNIVYPNVQ